VCSGAESQTQFNVGAAVLQRQAVPRSRVTYVIIKLRYEQRGEDVLVSVTEAVNEKRRGKPRLYGEFD
jgi:hypothetical protein